METESSVAERHDRESPVTQGTKPPGDERSTGSFTGKEAPVGAATQRMEQSQLSIAICEHDSKQTLETLETFDPLTGLYSRHAILAKLRDQVNLANRYKENFGLILLDIDHFRKVNDRYGHGTGDDVMEKVAALIRANIRDTDMPGRYGGDEFTIILPRTDLSSSWVAAERLRNIVEKTELKDSTGNIFTVTVSQGLVGWERNDDAASLISRADEALRKAQQKGRNRVQILLGPSLRDKV
jgi:polar amino acid transport system substrate-binding protein